MLSHLIDLFRKLVDFGFEGVFFVVDFFLRFFCHSIDVEDLVGLMDKLLVLDC